MDKNIYNTIYYMSPEAAARNAVNYRKELEIARKRKHSLIDKRDRYLEMMDKQIEEADEQITELITVLEHLASVYNWDQDDEHEYYDREHVASYGGPLY